MRLSFVALAKDLTQTLSGRIARASTAIDTNNPDVTPAMQAKTVSEQVTASLSDVATTTGQLETNDAELGTAIKASPDCTKLDKALAASG